MAILNPRSLIQTVDAFNQAFFLGSPWTGEAERLVRWLDARFGQPRAYAESFALTDDDWHADFRLFTGERITTRAARTHIIAEETIRVLTIIHRVTGLDCPARQKSEERLGERIFGSAKSTATQDGMYCCGPCSIALWRCLAAGAYAQQPNIVPLALASLARHRDGNGGWGRFPFYYTLLFLADLGPQRAAEEMDYCAPRLGNLQRLLERKTDAFSSRRLALINRLSHAR